MQAETHEADAAVEEREAREAAESPVELEVPESSEDSAVEMEETHAEPPAVELKVFDSDGDGEDDFSRCQESVNRLYTASADAQFALFPRTVELLRSYLADRKLLASTEVDGGYYLFAHKFISDDEIKDMGHAIETIIAVGMDLPMRPRIKVALNDLRATVEQLEHSLGKLPEFLHPYVPSKPFGRHC
ncbi:unnamed protein product [Phytophthora fragariaefolia]|uniref:Unnamed protein product n=1 Tax=Phytophthora fragariaefolia TaxID=1490495 RepID=A0A9W6XSG9_9STRA|nr:unnamed protein product [Phytophthora fragariaefolia]